MGISLFWILATCIHQGFCMCVSSRASQMLIPIHTIWRLNCAFKAQSCFSHTSSAEALGGILTEAEFLSELCVIWKILWLLSPPEGARYSISHFQSALLHGAQGCGCFSSPPFFLPLGSLAHQATAKRQSLNSRECTDCSCPPRTNTNSNTSAQLFPRVLSPLVCLVYL